MFKNLTVIMKYDLIYMEICFISCSIEMTCVVKRPLGEALSLGCSLAAADRDLEEEECQGKVVPCKSLETTKLGHKINVAALEK